jgi:hypothetical protein
MNCVSFNLYLIVLRYCIRNAAKNRLGFRDIPGFATESGGVSLYRYPASLP